MSLRILLVHPQNYLHSHKTGIYRKVGGYLPLTMPLLASLVPKDITARVRIVNEMTEKFDAGLEADLVGITAIAGTSLRAYEIADTYRARGVPVVMGGMHPTLMPEEALRHADSVVTGFAERTWPKLLNDFIKGRMERLYQPEGEFSFAGDTAVYRKNLKTTPYMVADTMELTRGCPHACEFCILQGAAKGRYYKKPIPQAIEELSRLKGKYVLFLDANLIGDKEYAKEFFLKAARLKKWWAGCVTADVADDDELMRILFKSGCRGLLFGFESLCEETLTQIHKPFTRAQEYKRIVKKIHSYGIAVHACFVFGFENDTESVFKETFNFVQEAKIDFPQYTLFTPFPGTPVFNRLISEKRILTADWSLYNGQNCVFRPRMLSPEALENGLRLLQAKTYAFSSVLKRLTKAPLWMRPILAITNANYKAYTGNIPGATKQWKLAQSQCAKKEDKSAA